MADPAGPIYEVVFLVASDASAAFDDWLATYVQQTSDQPGVLDCRAFAATAHSDGRRQYLCQHRLAAIDNTNDHVAATADRLAAALRDAPIKGVEHRGRVWRQEAVADPLAGTPGDCLNCGTPLRGQYCGHCGQRARSRLIRLRELVADAFGDLFELDSRLWRTLLPLLFKPGQLTHDYLQGRRARFMPPFRMYLVLSLIFFVVAFFNPREELALFYEPTAVAQSAADAAPESDDNGVVIALGDDGEPRTVQGEEDCDVDDTDIEGLPDVVARRLTPERLQEVCRALVADQGRSLFERVISNTPTALILLLPIMALALKILYPLSRRYYVEHLLFFVHFHAFLFLLLTLQVLFVRLATLLQLSEVLTTLAVIASACYAPVYLFIAMRRVYGQSRFVTFIKYVILTVAYLISFISIMSLTTLLAAFSQ